MNTNRFWIITALIFAVVLFRIIPHPFNFTPVMAMALFAGARFQDKRWSLILPVAVMFLSDLLLSQINNFPLFHNTIFFVYGAIILSAVMGWSLNSDKLNVKNTSIVTFISSVLFFIITNFGVWLFGGLYTLDGSGLVNCFTMAIPFFKYSILGDAFFVTVLFGGYELIRSAFPKLVTVPVAEQNR
jgi:hypothetical protein